MTRPADRPLAGIFWMIVTGLMFVAVTAIVKFGVSDLPAAQSAFLRYLLGLVFVIPMIGPMMKAWITREQAKLFGLRGVAHSIGVMLWFFAMTRITIAEVTAMNYMAPIYVALGAAVFLGERLQLRRIVAVVLAFLGAVIILRPGIREISSGHLAMIFAAMLLGLSYLLAKRLSGELGPSVIVGMLSITVTIGLAPLALMVWVEPSWSELGWIFLVALFATAGHYTMTLAFAAAPVTVTQPVTFLQLIWAVLLGAIAFSEPIDVWVVLGGGMILASVSFIAWREHVLKKQALTSIEPATRV